jgi:molybdenum cofactor biosynthesis enzyme MoaA
MPAEIFGNSYKFLGGDELLSFDEIVSVARVCADLGVEKIKLTGGEPLLRPFLHDLIGRLSEIPGIEDIGLITNGFYLEKPAKRLANAGLNRISVSLDSLDQEIFTRMAGRHAEVNQILSAMDAAADAGLQPVKVNMVVQRGVNDDQVVDFVRHFGPKGYTPRFIEYMDVGNRNGWERSHTVSSAELRERIGCHFTLTPLNANYGGEVATRYRVEELLRIRRAELRCEGLDRNRAVRGGNPVRSGLRLVAPNVGLRKEHLALQVGNLDRVKFDDADPPDPGERRQYGELSALGNGGVTLGQIAVDGHLEGGVGQLRKARDEFRGECLHGAVGVEIHIDGGCVKHFGNNAEALSVYGHEARSVVS